LKLIGRFDAAIFADAEENDSVDDALDSEIQAGLVEGVVAKRQIFSKALSPLFHFFQKGIIEFLGSGLAVGFDEFVECAVENCVF